MGGASDRAQGELREVRMEAGEVRDVAEVFASALIANRQALAHDLPVYVQRALAVAVDGLEMYQREQGLSVLRAAPSPCSGDNNKVATAAS